MSLLKKIEHDRNAGSKEATLVQECREEIKTLHRIFVTWFRGEVPLPELRQDLEERMLPNFSHVAPNGHMVKGRDVLIQYLSDKYGCYQDRVFRIDVYNVQLLWNGGNKCLASYEEWQSWDAAEGDLNDNNTNNEDTEGESTVNGKQQFGRLSTCLLEKKMGKYRWVHVHETWMEAEEPMMVEDEAPFDEESVMTGPAPPNSPGKKKVLQNGGEPVKTITNLALQPRDDADESSDEDAFPAATSVAKKPPPTTGAMKLPYGVDESSNNSDSIGASVDESHMSEIADQVGDLPSILDKNKMTPDEFQFMQNSHGILFFEEDESEPSQRDNVPPPKRSSGGNFNLDNMLENLDDEGGSKSIMDCDDPVLNSSQAMLSLHSAADASHKRHVSPRLQEYAKPLKWEGSLVGVSIAGFDIGTSQGPIADSPWYTEHGRKYEKKAQYAGSNKQGGKRKLCLPEMIFPVAHVALEGHGLWMSWDASDCLDQWATQHSHIPVGSDEEHFGVSVLKAQDAKLWQSRNREAHKHKSSKEAAFHYDWTYSSPFAAKVEGGKWIELDESGMRMALLTDQAVPILFFDEIVLYEDDLHDNGQVQYTIKLRIMPTCAYILARLWVRVDNVLVRVRETRVLVDFFGIQPQIYCDVTWRECLWENLETHGLPSSLRDWNCETGSETAEWNQLLSSIPTVDLPMGILAHATLEYGITEHDDDDGDDSMNLL